MPSFGQFQPGFNSIPGFTRPRGSAGVRGVQRAEQIRRRVGVNDQMRAHGRPSTIAERAASAEALGFYYVRLGIHDDDTQVNIQNCITGYTDAGLKTLLICDSDDRYGLGNAWTRLPLAMAALPSYGASCIGWENLNEPSLGTPPNSSFTTSNNAIVRNDAYMRAQLDALGGGWANVPIWGPSPSTAFAWQEVNGGIAPPALDLPYASVSQYHGYDVPMFSALEFNSDWDTIDPWVIGSTGDAYTTPFGALRCLSETGRVHSATSQPDGTTFVIRDTTAAPMICRAILYNAFHLRGGVVIYKLTDLTDVGIPATAEKWFGLCTDDAVAKASGAAVSTLLNDYLLDTAPDALTFPTAANPVTITSNPSSSKVLVCQKSTGTFLVFIWSPNSDFVSNFAGGGNANTNISAGDRLWAEGEVVTTHNGTLHQTNGTTTNYTYKDLSLTFDATYTVHEKTLIGGGDTALGNIAVWNKTAKVMAHDVIVLEMVAL